MIKYEVLHICKQTGARLGKLTIGDKEYLTPIFMPVGTASTVKGLDPKEIKQLSDGLILANTYHNWLEPGIEVIDKHQGIKNFMHWDGSLLTDSGGFQVFSLSKSRKITEEGVNFKSIINGDEMMLTPESCIDLQTKMGADIIMQLDECPNIDANSRYLKDSVDRSIRWAQRCKDHLHSDQALFGIVQGGLDKDLRLKSLKALQEINFPGYAVGGLAIGEEKEDMYQILGDILPEFDKDKPRYLMGVGAIDDILISVTKGIDMFDCVMPTRNARHGGCLTKKGQINIFNSKFKEDLEILDPSLPLEDNLYTKSYVRHLFKAKEMFGLRILTKQNLYFMKNLMNEIRTAIKEDRLQDLIDEYKTNSNYFVKKIKNR